MAVNRLAPTFDTIGSLEHTIANQALGNAGNFITDRWLDAWLATQDLGRRIDATDGGIARIVRTQVAVPAVLLQITAPPCQGIADVLSTEVVVTRAFHGFELAGVSIQVLGIARIGCALVVVVAVLGFAGEVTVGALVNPDLCFACIALAVVNGPVGTLSCRGIARIHGAAIHVIAVNGIIDALSGYRVTVVDGAEVVVVTIRRRHHHALPGLGIERFHFTRAGRIAVRCLRNTTVLRIAMVQSTWVTVAAVHEFVPTEARCGIAGVNGAGVLVVAVPGNLAHRPAEENDVTLELGFRADETGRTLFEALLDTALGTIVFDAEWGRAVLAFRNAAFRIRSAGIVRNVHFLRVLDGKLHVFHDFDDVFGERYGLALTARVFLNAGRPIRAIMVYSGKVENGISAPVVTAETNVPFTAAPIRKFILTRATLRVETVAVT